MFCAMREPEDLHLDLRQWLAAQRALVEGWELYRETPDIDGAFRAWVEIYAAAARKACAGLGGDMEALHDQLLAFENSAPVLRHMDDLRRRLTKEHASPPTLADVAKMTSARAHLLWRTALERRVRVVQVFHGSGAGGESHIEEAEFVRVRASAVISGVGGVFGD